MKTTVPDPKYKPMDSRQSELFILAAIESVSPGVANADKINNDMRSQIIDKRIEVLKLPIKFTTSAKLAVLALTDNPGKVVALLVDCLNNFEGQEITSREIAELYPVGFYDDATFERYIDEYLKPRKVKWAEIY